MREAFEQGPKRGVQSSAAARDEVKFSKRTSRCVYISLYHEIVPCFDDAVKLEEVVVRCCGISD